MRIEYRTCEYGDPKPKRCIVYPDQPAGENYAEAHAIITQSTKTSGRGSWETVYPCELYSCKFHTYVQLSPASHSHRERLTEAGYCWFWDCPRPELAAVAHSAAAGDCPPGVLFDLVREQPDCPRWVADWLDGLAEGG